MRPTLCFCATGKTGLGHLRRVTNVAVALNRLAPALPLTLLTNASPEGLAADERALYQQIITVERSEMAAELERIAPALVLVDTAVITGLERLQSRLVLLLRETRSNKLAEFALPGRRWDLLLLPHPTDDWRPAANQLPAQTMRSLGWVFRPLPPGDAPLPLGEPAQPDARRILIAAGAGGGERWQAFNHTIATLIPALRRDCQAPLEVIQVIGPRATAAEHLPEADRRCVPGSRLNELFAQADLVISSMGYNSALELAACDVPVLMLAKPTTYDDQAARAARWHQRLGWAYHLGSPAAAAAWCCDTLERRRRREPFRLDAHGAERAAAALLEALTV